MYDQHLRPGESQRAIEGHPGYFVTDHGRVFSFKRQGWQCSTLDLIAKPRELAPIETRLGRSPGRLTLVVSLKSGRKNVNLRTVSSLVAAAFIGPRPPGLGVLHGDDDPYNNNVSNLRYGTQAENNEDAFRNGGRRRKGQ